MDFQNCNKIQVVSLKIYHFDRVHLYETICYFNYFRFVILFDQEYSYPIIFSREKYRLNPTDIEDIHVTYPVQSKEDEHKNL